MYNGSVEYQMPPSFIPRKAAAAVQASAPRHAKRSVFALISVGALVLALCAAGSTFIYQKVLVARLTKMNDDLVAARAAFEPSFIAELKRMNDRLEVAHTLLAGHRAVSPLFSLLEKETLGTVRFNTFSIAESTPDAKTLLMELGGEATSFNAVALQSDIFSKESIFQNPVFSDFNVDKSGNVQFRFSADIAPEFSLYRAHLAARAAVPPPASAPVGGASAGTQRPSAAATATTTPSSPGEVQFGNDILF